MKLWLSKNSEISLREQSTRQIMLAIASGDLQAGDKLPSVREIALRLKIHPNTASAAYRWLEENGWVESRVGSGVYARKVTELKISETEKAIEQELDRLISSFLTEARRRGFENKQIKTRLNFRLQARKPQKIVIVENDFVMILILGCDNSAHFSLPVLVVDFAKVEKDGFNKNSLIVSLSDLAETRASEAAAAFVRLKLNSVQDSMRGKEKPGAEDLVGVVSHWEKFLRWSQTMLVAVGIGEENLVVRNSGEKDWKKGLDSCKFVITDSLTAKHLPAGIDGGNGRAEMRGDFAGENAAQIKIVFDNHDFLRLAGLQPEIQTRFYLLIFKTATMRFR
ncbi:MAG TPA: GntR family transcriptional regulator [Pyrinomonadaceae bacterium]|nr:GntR family transcriptional regulator [Pyrinomonadaceae bacterium]